MLPEHSAQRDDIHLTSICELELSRWVSLLTIFGSPTAPAIGRLREAAKAHDWPKKGGYPEKLGDLLKHPLLYFGTARRAEWEFVRESGKPESIEFQPSLNSNSGDFLLKAVEQGLGIARLPDFISEKAFASGSLVPILPNAAVRLRGIYVKNGAKLVHGTVG